MSRERDELIELLSEAYHDAKAAGMTTVAALTAFMAERLLASAALSEQDAQYTARVEQVARALHEDCVLRWNAIWAIDPERLVTQHMTDAHHGEAHRLVRRIFPELDTSSPTPSDTGMGRT